MTHIHAFEFNPFAENTYLVWDDSGACAIFDAGCYYPHERAELQAFISENKLRPVRLINTHCHLDHVFGNDFVARTWGLDLEIHRGELPVLERYHDVAQMYGIPNVEPQPAVGKFIEDGDLIEFGETRLQAILTPGHSPASLSFFCKKEGFVVAGDVLFFESIGRTDLPGGDFDTLINSIRTRLFLLPDATIVHPGHGPTTTIRHEKEYNPFL